MAIKKNKDTGLTPLQEQAVILLAAGGSITDTAQKICKDRLTIYKWLKEPAFEAYLNKVRGEIKEQAINNLHNLYNEAIEALKKCLQSKQESTKLKAATYILNSLKDFEPGLTDPDKVEARNNSPWGW